MTLTEHIAHLERTRVPVAQYASMDWFKALDEDGQHLVHERIVMICGDGPVTPCAYALAKGQVMDL